MKLYAEPMNMVNIRNQHIVRAMLCSVFALLWLTCVTASAQTDTIQGVINRYTRLTWIECTNRSTIEVQDPLGFHVGDRILLIQMRGASIDTDNDSSFGTPSYGNAGHYELATVDEIRGRLFTLKYELSRSYTLTRVVQVIRVPVYANVVIADTVLPKVWDDTSGGVVAFIATGTVTMNADINATGSGFRGILGRDSLGAWLDSLIVSGVSIHSATTYYTDVLNGDVGSPKGEGIHEPDTSYLCGRGNLANAGGGGNAQESGGGGGGNGGNGGTGGFDVDSVAVGGIGGRALIYSDSMKCAFMGGSGGSGGPPYEGTTIGGESGGGIVLIRASQINGNGHSILANGVDEPIRDSSRAGGGGGAGGAILLDVGSYTSSTIVQADGGKGGNTYSFCNQGPGGGGGGGCIWFSGSSSTPTNVTRTAAGGAHGTAVGCTDAVYGAADGSAGTILTNYAIPEGTIPR